LKRSTETTFRNRRMAGKKQTCANREVWQWNNRSYKSVPSPRGGLWWAYPPSKAPSPRNWNV